MVRFIIRFIFGYDIIMIMCAVLRRALKIKMDMEHPQRQSNLNGNSLAYSYAGYTLQYDVIKYYYSNLNLKHKQILNLVSELVTLILNLSNKMEKRIFAG